MTVQSMEHAHARADAGTLRNFVGGAWVEAQAHETLDVRNPADGALLARVPLSVASDVDAAVAAARAAQPGWRDTPVLQRARAVMQLRQVLDAHREELARLVTLDMGKTLEDARGEVHRGIESVEAACSVPMMMKGENLEGVARGIDVELVRQPVGVIAAITPFNFPAMIPLWFLPFAVATGNAFVLKPSERDPLTSERLMQLVEQVNEIPPGVVSLVHGGHKAVNALLEHPGVDGISFVGQASTARYVATRAAEHGKRVQALGGAKNSLVLMPDADMETSVRAILASAFGAAGQRCLAGSVLVAVGTPEEQDRACEQVVQAAAELTVGAGDDDATDICPLVGPDALERIEQAIAAADKDGARLLLDGRIGGGPAGTQLAATIVEAIDRESALARDELFGPLLSVVRATDLADALEFVNGSRYGNASMIFTSSGGAAREFKYGVEAGMVGVNVGVAAPVAWFPFAGWKDSIDGDLHANGADAFKFCTRKKVVTARWR